MMECGNLALVQDEEMGFEFDRVEGYEKWMVDNEEYMDAYAKAFEEDLKKKNSNISLIQ